MAEEKKDTVPPPVYEDCAKHSGKQLKLFNAAKKV